MQIRKAVIPAAGWGVRFLPVTKAVPKAMLPLVDRPLIQYAVEEAVSSGIDEIIIVTSPSHTAIEAHFKPSPDLERALEQKGEDRMLDTVRRVSSMAHIRYVSQTEQLGLGHAILIARALIGDEPFAVLLPDDIFDAHVPLVRQLLDVYHRYDECVIALWRVHSQETSRYGIATPERVEDGVYRILGTVEKPGPADAPSDLAILGRYVLSPAIFQALTVTPPGKGGEIQLTDALALLLKQRPVYGCEFQGTYYDAGKPLSLLKASTALAARHAEMGADFRHYIKTLAAEA